MDIANTANTFATWLLAFEQTVTCSSTRKGQPLSQGNTPSLFRVDCLKTLNLYVVTIHGLQNYFSDGRLTSTEYVRFCIERIRIVCIPALSKSRLGFNLQPLSQTERPVPSGRD